MAMEYGGHKLGCGTISWERVPRGLLFCEPRLCFPSKFGKSYGFFSSRLGILSRGQIENNLKD
jgi:hypothetical protein